MTLLLIAACSDYNVNPNTGDKDGDTGNTGTGPSTTQDFSDVCEGLEATTHSVPLNDECDQDLQTGSFDPVIEWDYGNSSFCGPAGVGQIVDTNGNGQLDADDLPAVLIYQGGINGISEGNVYALRGDGSGVFWSTSQKYGQDGGFAIGDLDGDGWNEVVTAGMTAVAALDGRDGSQIWKSESLRGYVDALGYNYPTISDMDGDGDAEVTVGSVILNGQTGATIAMGRGGRGTAPYGGAGSSTYGALSVPIDMDNDGVQELITGSTGYSPTGAELWDNRDEDGLVAVADFDGDGEGEIVKTSGIYVTGMETDGSVVWGPLTYTGNLGAPAVDDLDDDGSPDIVFAAQNSLIALDWGGATKWTARITDASGAAGPVLFDFELDGYPEVLYADEQNIRFFSGLDGSVKYEAGDHDSYTILETPVVADVDNDGHVEIVLGHCGYAGATKALTVYGDASDSWPQGRKTWNQHQYTITNVGDLGEIPTPSGNNFADYNSFRSGDVGQPPGEYYDLRGEVWDVCEDECDDGKVYVGGWAMNAGNLEVPAGIAVSLRAGPEGEILSTQLTTKPIPSGEVGEALVFEVAKNKLGGEKPVIEADLDALGSGVIYECNEDNNADNWDDAVCD